MLRNVEFFGLVPESEAGTCHQTAVERRGGSGGLPQALGQFQLSRFVNKVGLESIGDNLFIETAASGPAISGLPGAEGFGNLQQSYLEEANVNAVTEISSLIAAQRAYEMNSKVVTAADQMLSTTSQMFRS